MKNTYCEECGAVMQRWGKTAAGTPRYRCLACRKSAIVRRPDVKSRHLRDRFVEWLSGVQSKGDIARDLGLTRRTLTRKFRLFFRANPVRAIPSDLKPHILIVDGKYIEGRTCCVLVAVTEADRIFWRFASEERYGTWHAFLTHFPYPPKVVVADGHKGMARFVKVWWPHTAFQRCHFHMVLLVTKYLTREPKEEAGRVILDLTHRLKDVKTHEGKKEWLMFHTIWEKQYAKVFAEKTESGRYRFKKLRSVRYIMRRAVPNLFTYLDYPGCPNTTNLVEGWVNTAISEGLGRHRGLTLSRKKTLVAVILSHLRRPNAKEKPTRNVP